MRKYKQQRSKLEEDLARPDLHPSERDSKEAQLRKLAERYEHFNASQQLLLQMQQQSSAPKAGSVSNPNNDDEQIANAEDAAEQHDHGEEDLEQGGNEDATHGTQEARAASSSPQLPPEAERQSNDEHREAGNDAEP